MNRYRVIKIKRKARRNPGEMTIPGILGRINVIHTVDFKPRKFLKQLMRFWI